MWPRFQLLGEVIMKLAGYVSILFIAFFFSTTAPASVIDPDLPHISYVTFQSIDPVNPLTISATLQVPKNPVATPMPGVVIIHGSAGVDSRGGFYAEALNASGIATLEIDMWAPRGWLGGIEGRPAGVPETLPDAYGALKFFAEVPNIDSARIGIMGFSWGGVVTLLTATSPYTDQYAEDLNGLKFAAHVAHYPVCWIYNLLPGYGFNSFTGAPVLIQSGELDDYDTPEICPTLVDSLEKDFISVKMYRHATHAWDRLQPAITVNDPISHFGAGGEVNIVPNPDKAFQARYEAVNFFQDAFGMPH